MNVIKIYEIIYENVTQVGSKFFKQPSFLIRCTRNVALKITHRFIKYILKEYKGRNN